MRQMDEILCKKRILCLKVNLLVSIVNLATNIMRLNEINAAVAGETTQDKIILPSLLQLRVSIPHDTMPALRRAPITV